MYASKNGALYISQGADIHSYSEVGCSSSTTWLSIFTYVFANLNQGNGLHYVL